MANIGTLKKVADLNGLPILRGNIVSMILETPIAIDPTGEVAKNGAKVYAVRLKTPSGRPFDAGRAFMNEIKMGENAGKAMFTVKIGAQPGIPQAMELCAWPSREDGEWFLDMGRQSPAAPPPSEPETMNDSIPF